MDQAEERICKLEDKTFDIIQSEENKERPTKKVNKAYMIYGISSKEPTCRLLEFQEERGTRGWKVILKK